MLTLLCDAAEAQPLVCVVVDAQWLDQASAQTLEFVARRLRAERVVMAFAVRTSDQLPKLTGLPELVLSGLAGPDAAALLVSAVAGRLDGRVRSRVLAEARGNPLALLELPRQLSSTELAFGTASGPASPTTLISRLEEGFLRQMQDLPEQSRQLLLLAAADPVGDIDLLRRAAQRVGIGDEALGAADTAGLLELRHRVEFRHPSSGRPFTAPPRRRGAATPTRLSPRSRTRTRTRTAPPGTVPARRPALTRPSPPSSIDRLTALSGAAESRRRPHSWKRPRP